VAFDMDGVLVDYRSCWTWIHDHFGVSNEVSYNDFIAGRIDDMEFMRRDIALWKEKSPELEEEDLRCILDPLPITDGIAETVSQLKRAGIRTTIVSGGLDIVAERIANSYGFDEYWANGVETDENGRLTGEGVLRVELRNKATALRSIMARHHGAPEQGHRPAVHHGQAPCPEGAHGLRGRQLHRYPDVRGLRDVHSLQSDR